LPPCFGSVGPSNGNTVLPIVFLPDPDYVFAFHDGEEIGPKMLSKIAKRTGLTPEDL